MKSLHIRESTPLAQVTSRRANGFVKIIFALSLVALLGPTAQARVRGFPIPTPDSQPISIVLGPDGNLWFTEQNASNVARVTPDGVITQFRTPTLSFPLDITTGPDGNLWFVEGAGKIGRITPQGVITEFGSGLSLPFSIASGADGNIWFAQRFKPEIGKITPAGEFTFYPTPGNPEQIAPGHGKTLIFTEFGNSRIAKITTDGVVTESPEIRSSNPTGIAAGPDRNIWFLGYGNDMVYRATFAR